VFMLWSCKYIAWCSTTTTSSSSSSSSSSNCQTICWICIRLQVYFELSNVRELVFIYKFAVVCKLVPMWEFTPTCELASKFEAMVDSQILGTLVCIEASWWCKFGVTPMHWNFLQWNLEPRSYLCFFAHTIFFFFTLELRCKGGQEAFSYIEDSLQWRSRRAIAWLP
jgi:hypothetical protein